jgi:hypothetical protein
MIYDCQLAIVDFKQHGQRAFPLDLVACRKLSNDHDTRVAAR